MIDFVIDEWIENPNFNSDYFNEFLILSKEFKNSIEDISEIEEN